MTANETRRHEMFIRIREFGITHRDRFPAETVGGQAFAAVDSAITELDAQAVLQLRARQEGQHLQHSVRVSSSPVLISCRRAENSPRTSSRNSTNCNVSELTRASSPIVWHSHRLASHPPPSLPRPPRQARWRYRDASIMPSITCCARLAAGSGASRPRICRSDGPPNLTPSHSPRASCSHTRSSRQSHAWRVHRGLTVAPSAHPPTAPCAGSNEPSSFTCAGASQGQASRSATQSPRRHPTAAHAVLGLRDRRVQHARPRRLSGIVARFRGDVGAVRPHNRATVDKEPSEIRQALQRLEHGAGEHERAIAAVELTPARPATRLLSTR